MFNLNKSSGDKDVKKDISENKSTEEADTFTDIFSQKDEKDVSENCYLKFALIFSKS